MPDELCCAYVEILWSWPAYNHMICCRWHRWQFIWILSPSTCSSPDLSLESLFARGKETIQAKNVFTESSPLHFQDKLMLDRHQSYQIISWQDLLDGCQLHKVAQETHSLMCTRCLTKWGEPAFNLNNDDVMLWKAGAANCSFFNPFRPQSCLWHRWSSNLNLNAVSTGWYYLPRASLIHLPPLEQKLLFHRWKLIFLFSEHHIWSSSGLNFWMNSFFIHAFPLAIYNL